MEEYNGKEEDIESSLLKDFAENIPREIEYLTMLFMDIITLLNYQDSHQRAKKIMSNERFNVEYLRSNYDISILDSIQNKHKAIMCAYSLLDTIDSFPEEIRYPEFIWGDTHIIPVKYMEYYLNTNNCIDDMENFSRKSYEDYFLLIHNQDKKLDMKAADIVKKYYSSIVIKSGGLDMLLYLIDHSSDEDHAFLLFGELIRSPQYYIIDYEQVKKPFDLSILGYIAKILDEDRELLPLTNMINRKSFLKKMNRFYTSLQ